jgi:flagellar motor switch protein FliM
MASHPTNAVDTVPASEILGAKPRSSGERRIKLYDFKRPDKFSKDQIRTIYIMHETFSRLAATKISARLRVSCRMSTDVVDQLTYEEFVRSIPPQPVPLAVVHMEPLKGAALMEMDPSLSSAILARCMGGRSVASVVQRDFTPIEGGLMGEMFTQLLDSLGEAWAAIVDLKPRLAKIETSPQFAQIVPPTEMIVMVSFGTKIGEAEGTINLCIPYVTIEPLISKLSARYWYSSIRKGSGARPRVAVGKLKVESQLYADGEALSLKDLFRLKKGSLVKLPAFSQGEAGLRVGGNQILWLRRDRRGSFSVVGSRAEESEAPGSFLETRRETEEAGKWERLLRSSNEELATQINEGTARLSNRIENLSRRQEELADQLVFGISERELPGEEPFGGPGRPFGFLRTEDAEQLAAHIAGEHPQTIALILSYLEPESASVVLNLLDEGVRVDAAERRAGAGEADESTRGG